MACSLALNIDLERATECPELCLKSIEEIGDTEDKKIVVFDLTQADGTDLNKFIILTTGLFLQSFQQFLTVRVIWI